MDQASEVRAARFAAYSAAKDAAQQRAKRLRQAESDERGAEQTLIAAQDEATRAARAAAERACTACLAGSGNPPPDPVGGSRGRVPHHRCGCGSERTGRWRKPERRRGRGPRADRRSPHQGRRSARGAGRPAARRRGAPHSGLPPSPMKRRAGTRAGPPPPNQVAELARRQEELNGELTGAEQRAAADRRQAQRAARCHRTRRSRAQ